jgi:hypothetical protein
VALGEEERLEIVRECVSIIYTKGFIKVNTFAYLRGVAGKKGATGKNFSK